MKCPRCQADNLVDTKFCGQCAAPLILACPSCGAPNPLGNRVCDLGAASLISAPFILAGGLKLIYDLALWRTFSALKPPEEAR